jgi:muramoyltetrapeptide carboxypeptidase LdcA involved in peptidoglycan recycling
VLKHLDLELIRANPKPFFGYSDNTNLHMFLFNLGVVSYHGSAVITKFAGLTF